MKVTATAPTRISMFGGGTDVAPFCDDYGGLVINLAINLRNKVVIEEKETNGLIEKAIRGYGFYEEGIPSFNVKVQSIGQQGGIGSSGSVAVATLGALKRWCGQPIERHQAAQEAFELEVISLGWHGGCQDQYAAAYGGFNLMEIGPKVRVTPLPPQAGRDFLPWIVLFDTGVKRESFKIQEGFKKPAPPQTKALMRLKGIVYQAQVALAKRSFFRLGELLNETWEEKKRSNRGVTNRKIDKIMIAAKKAGALGGKISGAGGGGHCWFVCEPDKQEKLREALEKRGLRYIDFSIDFNGLEVKKE